MRTAILAFFLAAIPLAGCDGPTVVVDGTQIEAAAPGEESYALEVYVSEGDQIYLVTDTSDGTRAAARVSAGLSSFLDPAEARTLLSTRQGAMATPTQEQVAVTLPGFSVRVQADDATADGGGENARVAVNLGGQEFEVNSTGDGPTGQVQTRISGLSAEAARSMIVDMDELDPGVQQQMLDALGL